MGCLKSPAELKDAHDFLCAVISGHLPISMSRKDAHILEAQKDVLCFVLECENSDCFKTGIDSLRDLVKQVRVMNNGRRFKSRALVE